MNLMKRVMQYQTQNRVIPTYTTLLPKKTKEAHTERGLGLLTRAVDKDEVRTDFDHQRGGVQPGDHRRKHRRNERLPHLLTTHTHTHKRHHMVKMSYFLQGRGR